ncbi:MAG: TetR/AcrR family transcriptional regulator [Acidobacteria bacterium]|nr:TetR/AcrR family transcriptional regulator [Acidobacteriota bacterium]
MRAVAVREDIKDLILDAAERLLVRYGFKKMTMDDLAQEIGIAKGTIYLHFSSKEEIALSRVDRVIDRLYEELWKIARSKENPSDRLQAMLMTRVLFRFDSVQHYAESIDEQMATIRPALEARRKKYFEKEAQILVQVLQEGKRQKVFFFEEAGYTAHTLLVATNALLPSKLKAVELKNRQNIEKRISQISRLLVNGLSVKN